jgi:hypothetical protein
MNVRQPMRCLARAASLRARGLGRPPGRRATPRWIGWRRRSASSRCLHASGEQEASLDLASLMCCESALILGISPAAVRRRAHHVLPYSRRHYLQSMHVTEPKIIAAFSLELAQIAEIPKDELQPLMQCTVPPPAAPATPQGPQVSLVLGRITRILPRTSCCCCSWGVGHRPGEPIRP